MNGDGGPPDHHDEVQPTDAVGPRDPPDELDADTLDAIDAVIEDNDGNWVGDFRDGNSDALDYAVGEAITRAGGVEDADAVRSVLHVGALDRILDARDMTLAQAFAVAGSANHDADGATHETLRRCFAELHPVVAGSLVGHLRAGLDADYPRRGTASGSEHPDWHATLRRTLDNSSEEGYDD